MDNDATHKLPEVREWLTRCTRWTSRFTPTLSSWLNAVEGLFAKLIKRRLKRGVLHPLVSLKATINRLVAEINSNPVPVRWTRNPDRIIAAVKRGNQASDLSKRRTRASSGRHRHPDQVRRDRRQEAPA